MPFSESNMFETRSECSFFRMASSSSLLNLAPGTSASTSDALLAQSKKADATKSASGERAMCLPRFWSARCEGGKTNDGQWTTKGQIDKIG